MSSDPSETPTAAVDFGKAAADYRHHRQGFPPAFFARLEAVGIGRAGQRVLDIGTGTGLLARAFALRGALVTGLDASAELIAQAREADTEAGVAIDYVVAPAEATGLPDGAYDVVSAGTCWHWFDRPRAAREARRLLKPGGRLLIAHLDFHRLPDNVIDTTLTLIERFNPAKIRWTTFLFPLWMPDLAEAGFGDFEAFAFSTRLAYSHEAWRGRIRASAGVGPAMDPETLRRFDTEHAALLRDRFPDDPLAVDHRIFALIAKVRPGA